MERALDGDWINELTTMHLYYEARGLFGVAMYLRRHPLRRYEERFGPASVTPENEERVRCLDALVDRVNSEWPDLSKVSEREYRSTFDEMHELVRGYPFFKAA